MVVTGKEEIAKQHQEAIDIVSSSMPCAPMIDRGEIPLEWKLQPTAKDPLYAKALGLHVDNSNDEEEIEPRLECEDMGPKYAKGCCISSRGIVNVDRIAQLLIEGCHSPAPVSAETAASLKKKKLKSTSNLWDEVNAAKNNVHITRPSHDKWGIKKIVLIFCDDFLQKVYEMPWWHQSAEMRDAVKPILDNLGVRSHRIVRMLFAALPPGVTIPVHHDTGEWVRHTHRVHIPIIVTDANRVLFRCGPTESSMDRVDCTPGHVFEMNNQAKHAVSNCQEDYRVHMILDYVDESFVIRDRIKLSKGEEVVQTRRSIDRIVDKGNRPTPSFMIIGAQKSGTTSIYEYINQHPLVMPPKRRETHCLDWRWNDNLKNTAARQKHCLSFFLAAGLYYHPSCMTGDSTPSYLLDSYRCIPRLKEVFPHEIKFISILRNPVKRAKSHFEMVTSLDGNPAQIKARGKEWLKMSFEEVVELDMRNMKDSGLIPYWNIEAKTTDMEVFNNFVGTKEEDAAYENYLKKHVTMNSGSHSLISRGMYELQLRQWYNAFPKDAFLVLTLEAMKNGGIQKTMEKVFDHLDLPHHEVKDEGAKNSRSYGQMKEDTMESLQRFYAPHNVRLQHLLGDEWSKIWEE